MERSVPALHANKKGKTAMLFCLTAQYTPTALNAIMENPTASRAEAIKKLLEAAGGKLVSMYSTVSEGPGVMVIFDVPDPAMAPAISGVAVSGGAVQNLKLMRLLTQEEVVVVRQNAQKIRGAYKAPGN
jgi:uncharacterized protein with GYD domain